MGVLGDWNAHHPGMADVETLLQDYGATSTRKTDDKFTLESPERSLYVTQIQGTLILGAVRPVELKSTMQELLGLNQRSLLDCALALVNDRFALVTTRPTPGLTREELDALLAHVDTTAECLIGGKDLPEPRKGPQCSVDELRDMIVCLNPGLTPGPASGGWRFYPDLNGRPMDMILKGEDGSTTLRVLTPIARTPWKNPGEFYKGALRHNGSLHAGYLSIEDDLVSLVMHRTAIGLDLQELDLFLRCFIDAAVKLPNELISKYGARPFR